MRTLLFMLILMITFGSGCVLAGSETPVRAEVKPHNGTPALFIDGKPVYVTGFLAGVAAEDKVYKEMAGSGIHFYMDYVSIGNEAEGKRDFSVTDAYFARIIALDPNARFIPRIGVTAPGWWQEKHKEECCKYASSALGPQSFASELWKKDMKEDVTEFIKHVRSSSYANRVLGFLVCSGYTAEWQSWGLWSRQLGDFSEASTKGFRRWLTAKYKTDDAIRSAWKDSSVTIETASIPRPKERIQSSMMNFRDPEKDGAKVTDFYLYYSDATADAIAFFAGVVKEASDRNMLAGCFYGYLNQHGLFQQESGHNALSKVLDCPDIDFLASPSCYSIRGPGGVSNFMTMAESVQLHGKLFFNESDIRTFLSREQDPFGRCKTPAETLAVLKREAGHVLSRGAYTWWFDMAGGWFSDKRILSLLSQVRKASEESITSDRKGSAEIAVIFDDRSSAVMRPGQLAVHLMVESVVTWPRVGASMDFYLLSDIAHPDMSKHKLYVFVNTFQVSGEQTAAIHEKLKKDNATALWIYAPGYVEDDKLSTEGMSRLTGIKLVCEPKELPATITINKSHKIAAGENWTEAVGTKQSHGPLFYADDPEAEIIGVLDSLNKPGFVIKKMDGWTSIFYASPYLQPKALRAVADYAGVHIYSRSNDCFYANRGVISLHASTAGEKIIKLPQKADVYDLLTGDSVSKGSDILKLKVKANDTVLLSVR